jgi:hypothetical protein
MTSFYADPVLQKHHNDAFTSVPRVEEEEVLPPGIDRKAFQHVLSLFSEITGEENTISGEQLYNFRDPYPLSVEKFQPSAAAL